MPPETRPESQPAKGTVFLTFDDGPNRGTENLVDVLKDHDVRGTIFMVGKRARAYKGKLLDKPHVLAEVADVGNHSDTHYEYYSPKKKRDVLDPHTFYRGDNSAYMIDNFERAEKALDPFGLNRNLARLPGSNTWRVDDIVEEVAGTREEADAIAAKKYRVFGWDVEWERGFKMNKKPASAEQVADSIEAHLTRGNTRKPGKVVVLMHDDMFSSEASAARLSALIRALKKRKLNFEVLSKY